MGNHRLVYAGDSSLILELDERIDPEINARAIAIAEAIGRRQIDGVRDIVPTYRSVAVYFDPLRTDGERLAREIDVLEHETDATPSQRPPIDVPVCYGGLHGPDLSEVATLAGCSEREVIDRHRQVIYRVYMLGFVPGFAYMGTVDEKIRVSRRSSPRQRVPSGSVGIAGIQTGVYSMETPGGWRLIGRTPVKPFDPDRASAFRFAPGDSVRFVAIDEREYDRLTTERG